MINIIIGILIIYPNFKKTLNMSNPLLEILQQQVAKKALSGLGRQLGIENESY